MTFEELTQVFKRVAIYAGFPARWFDELAHSHGLPFTIRYIATELWLKELPENEDTAIFRQQCLAVGKEGVFNISK